MEAMDELKTEKPDVEERLQFLLAMVTEETVVSNV